MTATLSCPRCHLALDPAAASGGAEVACAACRAVLTVRLFPAFETPPEAVSAASGERALEGEAVCFFHADKRAAATCERCGRFLCALCDVPFAGKHLCPSCLDASKLPDLINRRVVWGQVAALFGMLPLALCFLWPFYFITGPCAIFLALWKWKEPGSLVHGPRHGLAILGVIGGVLQVATMIGLVWGLIFSIRNG
ncbi:MAG: hypothetical protein ABMA13_05195 [Chthoniobacteraceae bacterium]